MVDFHCGKDSRFLNDTAYCFSSSPNVTCAISSDFGYSCTNCPEGYTRDFSFGHYPTCNLPTRYFEIFFIVVTPCYFFMSTLFLRLAFKLSKTPRKMSIYTCLLSLFFWLWSLGLYLENGMFTLGLIAYLFMFEVSVVFGAHLEYFLFQPVYAAFQRPMNFMIFSVILRYSINILVTSSLLITMLVYSVTSQQKLYNYYYEIYLICSVTFLLTNCGFIFIHSRRLRKIMLELKSSSGNSDSLYFDTLISRLLSEERILFSIMFPLALMQFLMFILSFVFQGSIPYQFVFVSIYIGSVITGIPSMYHFLNSKNKKDSNVSRPNFDKDDIKSNNIIPGNL